MKTRNPNSQECSSRGYKLSCVDTGIATSEPFYTCIGCDEDDTFYTGTEAAGRVVLLI